MQSLIPERPEINALHFIAYLLKNADSRDPPAAVTSPGRCSNPTSQTRGDFHFSTDDMSGTNERWVKLKAASDGQFGLS